MQALLKKSICRLEQELGLQLAFEEGSSKYFPASNSAQEVRDCLVAACLRLGVKIRYNAGVTSLADKEDHWHCQLADDSSFESSKIVSTRRHYAAQGKQFVFELKQGLAVLGLKLWK